MFLDENGHTLSMAILYVVSTPIGNLEDISARALRILKEVDLILCEDTRVTKKLLNRYEISAKTVSYHQHSSLRKTEYILGQLKKGKKLALVSDAGTPAISDPGAKLIDELCEKIPELQIISIPGPSAVTAALSIAGFPADKFVFFGFPPKKKKRKKFFKQVAIAEYTAVFYESCHRILRSLNDLADASIESKQKKRLAVCQELTKKFEKVYRGTPGEILCQLAQNKIKGEFVVVVEKWGISTACAAQAFRQENLPISCNHDSACR